MTLAVVALALLATTRVAAAQAPAQPPPAAAVYARAAQSLKRVQIRAAEIVTTREVRPEARALADNVLSTQREALERLTSALRANGAPVSTELLFEHRVLIDNLEPLDLLALSRRYVEFAAQALDQETQLQTAAAASAEPWVKALADDMLPRLGALTQDAQRARQAVGP